MPPAAQHKWVLGGGDMHWGVATSISTFSSTVNCTWAVLLCLSCINCSPAWQSRVVGLSFPKAQGLGAGAGARLAVSGSAPLSPRA